MEADVKILLLVPNCTWVSRPITASQGKRVSTGLAIYRERLRVNQFYETEAVEKLFFFECDKYNFLEVIAQAPKQTKPHKILGTID